MITLENEIYVTARKLRDYYDVIQFVAISRDIAGLSPEGLESWRKLVKRRDELEAVFKELSPELPSLNRLRQRCNFCNGTGHKVTSNFTPKKCGKCNATGFKFPTLKEVFEK